MSHYYIWFLILKDIRHWLRCTCWSKFGSCDTRCIQMQTYSLALSSVVPVKNSPGVIHWRFSLKRPPKLHTACVTERLSSNCMDHNFEAIQLICKCIALPLYMVLLIELGFFIAKFIICQVELHNLTELVLTCLLMFWVNVLLFDWHW